MKSVYECYNCNIKFNITTTFINAASRFLPHVTDFSKSISQQWACSHGYKYTIYARVFRLFKWNSIMGCTLSSDNSNLIRVNQMNTPWFLISQLDSNCYQLWLLAVVTEVDVSRFIYIISLFLACATFISLWSLKNIVMSEPQKQKQ